MMLRHSLLAEPIAQFLAHHRALGKRFDTEAAALQLLERYLLEQQITTLEAITAALLEAFLGTRPRASARSHNHLLNVLQRFFAWLERQGLLCPNPLHSRPRHATAQAVPFLFEPAQVEQLLRLAKALPDARRTHRRGAAYRMSFAFKSVAVLVIHFGTPSRQNDCARRQPLGPGSPRSGPLLRHEQRPLGAFGLRNGPTANGLTACGMRFAYPLRGRVFAPSPLRVHARAHAYRGLRAFASLSLARSGCIAWDCALARSRDSVVPTSTGRATA